MRILYVCNEYPPTTHGGIGVFVKELAEGLVEQGHQAAVIGYDPLVETTRHEYENGVWVKRLPLKNYKSLRFGRFHLSLEPVLKRKYLSDELETFIEKFKPDIVESYDWSGPLWRKPSVKLVVRMHGANTTHQYYESKRPSIILRFFERKNILFADSLCAVSNHIGQLTLKAFRLCNKKYICIYNFVDTEKFKPIPGIVKDPNKLLYFGRIHPRKGLTELFHIIKYLFQINNQVYLELAGSYSNKYKQELSSILPVNLRHRVKFLGNFPHHELPKLISSAMLFVMPSRTEAFGLTVIEAMACGTPTLMTDKASGPEIIQDGITGWLFSNEKAEESAYMINNILHQISYIDRVGKSGKDYVLRRFSKKVVLEKNILFYNSLLLR